MVRKSTDQIAAGARQRYLGKGGINNIASDVMAISKLLNVEEKHTDSVFQGSITLTAPLQSSPFSIAEGTDSNQRTGRSVKVVRIDGNFQFIYSTGTALGSGATQYFNWYLVRYKKTPAASGTAVFNINEFLLTDTNGNISPLSLVNSDTIENFAILQMGQVSIDLQFASSTNVQKSKLVSFSHECGFHMTYNGTSAGNISDNDVQMVFTASDGINAGGQSLVLAGLRLFFVDN
jgi:hypothetical protein